MFERPTVCIVIPFFNGDKFIKACIVSILNNSYPDVEICVVNNSTENTDIYEIVKLFNNVEIIETEPKIGFGRACNRGLAYAINSGAAYTIFLNQDTILDPSCIQNLLKPFGEASSLAISAPISFTYDFKSIEEHFVRWFIIQCPELLSDLLQNNLRSYYPMKEVSGACLAIKNEVVRKLNLTALFDPLFFMYMEDIDLCRRLRFWGFSIALVPTAKIAHVHNHTAAHEGAGKEDINNLNRRSRGIFMVKDPCHSFNSNIRNFMAISMVDYFYNLTKLRLSKIFTFMYIDGKILLSINAIFKSRNMDCAKVKRKSI